MRKALYILGDLIDEDIIFLAREGNILTLKRGDSLIDVGESVQALFIVTDGELEVTTPDGDNLAELGVGDVVGEMSFIESQPPDVAVSAASECRVLAIPRPRLSAELERNPEFAARFYKALATFLSDRLRSMTPGASSDELDERLLDIVHVAGDRLRRLIDMLESR